MFYNTLIIYGIQKLPVSYSARELFLRVDRGSIFVVPQKRCLIRRNWQSTHDNLRCNCSSRQYKLALVNFVADYYYVSFATGWLYFFNRKTRRLVFIISSML